MTIRLHSLTVRTSAANYGGHRFSEALAGYEIFGRRAEIPCRANDPDLWFPTTTKPEASEAAKALCQTCPLMDQCLQAAVERREAYGVWGGLNFETEAPFTRTLRGGRKKAAEVSETEAQKAHAS